MFLLFIIVATVLLMGVGASYICPNISTNVQGQM
ncbi:hypothetical protein NTHI1209_01748 [Haemophilus influenzae]|uniref:Uncharacterized protein n=1 Tax=Haemophilus influenzae TaxID=727 RepID=A0A158SZ14_HAEIF|nr:hypothetical protein NTHI1209_01748 [Haemophilus influenzae]